MMHRRSDQETFYVLSRKVEGLRANPSTVLDCAVGGPIEKLVTRRAAYGAQSGYDHFLKARFQNSFLYTTGRDRLHYPAPNGVRP
jgi:hypothetical protein